MNKKLLFIFTVAFVLRFISLDQSLWLDEATTARVVQQYNFLEIITKFSPQDFHPPLYYLFMKLWTMIFDYSEVTLRLPSVIFSLGTGWVIYLIGRTLKNKAVGFYAAVFFLFNPLIMYYSQEARMYMMATFFLTMALYFLIKVSHAELGSVSDSQKAITKTRSRNKFGMTEILLFSLSISVSFLTFYGSVFLIVPMFLYLVYKKRYKTFFISFFILNLSFLFILPLFLRQFENARESLQIVVNWKSVLGTVSLKNLLLIPLKFSIGRISFNPKWAYWAISGMWTAFIWFFVIKGGLKNKFFLFLITSPLILAVLFSFFSPLLQYFRFLYLIPVLGLLLGQYSHLKGVRVVVLTGFLVFSFAYLLFPQFHREDWKSLSKSLPSRLSLFMVYSSSDPIQYYRGNIKIHDFSELAKQNTLKEIVVVPYTADIHGVNYQVNLVEGGFKKVEERSFRGIVYEKWSK